MRNIAVFLMSLTLLAGISRVSSAQTTNPTLGAGKVIGLDYFYNHQVRNGKQFHYIWDDTDRASGYSKFGDVWKAWGASLANVDHAPTADDLNKLSIYIICDPNTPEKAADHKPNYIEQPAIDTIAAWVHDGGVLAVFANDKNNCEFDHLNQLTQKFGITFNGDLRNTVPTPRDRAHGTFDGKLFPDHPLFKDVHAIYMKEISTITVTDPATALLIAPKETGDGTDIIMATSHYGKGLVFAVGDPWVYNEYIDVTSPGLPLENRKAANNLVQWLLGASSPPKGN